MFWLYILLCTRSTIQLWCCVSFFGSGGKQFLVLRTYLVYNTVVRLCQFFCCGGKVLLRPEKSSSRVAGKFYYDWKRKIYSCLSGQLCCCVSFWFWREIGFGCTYYYVLGVPYSCGVVLVFLVLEGNCFWCYVRTQCTIQIAITSRKKVIVGKKSSSHLSGRCAIVITTGKKSARSLLRQEKKSSSRDFYAKLNVSNLNVTNLYQFQLKLI